MTFDEKIEQLKRIHSKSAPEALEQIRSWEEKMVRLNAQKEWLNHPSTAYLRQVCVDQIININYKLISDSILSEIDRKALLAERGAHIVYLATLTEYPDQEIKAIEKAVNNELQ